MTKSPAPQASDETVSVPRTPKDISPQWLGAALAETCDLGASQVTSIDIEEIGIGRGNVGLVLRLKPVYDGTPTDAPASLVAKLPKFVERARDHDRMMINVLYSNEIRWYSELSGHCPVRVPQSYWGGMDLANGRFCLLLEDLGDLGTRDQLHSCGAADAFLAVTQLARIHAAWWGDEALEQRAWMLSADQLGAAAMRAWDLGWDRFRQFFDDELTPEVVEFGGRLGGQMLSLSQRAAESGSTLVHGDYRLENLLFGDPEGEDDLCVLDWQGVSRGSGLRDLAYFVGQSLTVDLRREIEDDLLRLYHDTLGRNGVSDYGYQQCYDDYRMGLLAALWIPVNGLRMFPHAGEDQSGAQVSDDEKPPLDKAPKSGEAQLRTITKRNIAAILDNDAQAMLED